jgi:hypothetical protein
MYNKSRFRIGQRLSGNTVNGQKIIGNYAGARDSFGFRVLGVPVDSPFETPKEFVILRLTAQAVREQPKKTKLKHGDPCRGRTKTGQEIIGNYVQSAGKGFAYMRGVIAQDGLISFFEPTQVYKVTLK